MAEYIDREAVLEETEYDGNYRLVVPANMVKSLPAADVAPVIHGRWVWSEDKYAYICSACDCEYDYRGTYGLFDHGFWAASYCPNCGAKMDGGADHETN